MTMCIYQFVSPSGKSYIGKTIDLKRRCEGHKKNIERGVKSKFYDACRKYGFENFKLIVLENNLTEDEMNEREKYYIEKFNTFGKNSNGYNMTEGGDGISKGQFRVLYTETNHTFIGSKEILSDTVVPAGKGWVAAINVDNNKTVYVDAETFNNSPNLVGVSKDTKTVFNTLTNTYHRVGCDESGSHLEGVTKGRFPAWDLRDNTKKMVTTEEYKNSTYFKRHLRDWYAPKARFNENAQHAWGCADIIMNRLEKGESQYMIQKDFVSKIEKICENIKNGWNPLRDEIWKLDFGYKA